MFEKIFKPKTETLPHPRTQEAKEKPRIIWYEDKNGNEHELEGILETEASPDLLDAPAPERPSYFWYINKEGARIKVKGVRNWWYGG